MPLQNAIDKQRLDIATALETSTIEERETIAQAAVIDFGGTFVPAATGGRFGPQLAEINLLGVSHLGNTTEECVANWIKAVFRTAMEDAA